MELGFFFLFSVYFPLVSGTEAKLMPINKRTFWKTRIFKGLSHEIDLAFEDVPGTWSVVGLNRGRGQYLNFLGTPMI